VKNPQKYYYSNVVGTLNLLRAMLEHHVEEIVFSSSAAVYGDPEATPMRIIPNAPRTRMGKRSG